MDKIKIGEIIYGLRKAKKITQEQLGEFIGVSKGAISKWESGVSYPDIEMLPVLARFFEITIDELLNYDVTISEEMEEKICEECQKEIYEGSPEKALELCKSYIKKYTRNYKLKFTLTTLMTISSAFINDEEKRKKIYGKAINVYEDIVANSSDNEIVEASRLQLSMYYADFEEYDKALESLDKMKKSICDVDYMKATVYIKQGELKKGRKMYQECFVNAATQTTAALHGLAASYYKDDLSLAEKYMNFSIEITKLINEGDIYRNFTQYIHLAGYYAYHKKKKECLDMIKKVLESLSKECNYAKDMWYLNELNYDDQKQANGIMKISKAVITMLEQESYDFIKDDSDFIELKDKIAKLEK